MPILNVRVFALFLMTGSLYAGLMIPQSEWGPGTSSVPEGMIDGCR